MRESKIKKKGLNRRRGKGRSRKGKKEGMLKRGGKVKPEGKRVLSRNTC